jgi:hypothetical protein
MKKLLSGVEGSAGDETHAARDRSAAAIEPAVGEVAV